MSLTKRALVAGLLVVSQGCYLDFRGPGKPRLVTAARPGLGSGGKANTPLGGGFGLKIVEYKRRPVQLVARDGTSCTVPQNRFDRTDPGESVWCTWLGSNR
jgi:hypothetical protein